MDTVWKRADADWFMRAGWGVFTHYLVGEHFPEGQRTTADAWNRAVEAFDVEGLAAQLAAVGATRR